MPKDKLEIVEELKVAMDNITSAGLTIMVQDDSVLNPKLNTNALSQLTEAYELVMKARNIIKENMKGE